jgi:hypothetical protein
MDTFRHYASHTLTELAEHLKIQGRGASCVVGIICSLFGTGLTDLQRFALPPPIPPALVEGAVDDTRGCESNHGHL